MASKRGLQGVAITDHDTLAGNAAACVLGKQAGVRVIPGVEISTFDYTRNRKAHILCYAPRDTAELTQVIGKISEERKVKTLRSAQKITKIYPISLEMILRRAEGSVSLFSQHIMLALMDAGYTTCIFGELFHQLFDSKDGLAPTNIDYPDIFDIIDVVRRSGGTIVLAHPSEYHSMDLLRELCEKRLIDGIEVNHPRNREEDKAEMLFLSRKYGVFITSGTDFHGFMTSRPYPVGTYGMKTEELQSISKLAEFTLR
jgi:predicted metal-dependent phosphoesterase TrpH